MNWHEYPILRLVVPLIIGILFYMQFPEWSPPLISNLLMLLIIAFLAWPKKYLFPYKHRYISGFIIYLAFFLIGNALSQFHHSYQNKNYYGNNISQAKYVLATLVEPPEDKARSIKLVVEISKMGTLEAQSNTNGLAVLYLAKDSISKNLHYGDRLFFRNELKAINAAQNPDEFNYQAYLNNSGIKYQAYLRSGQWHLTSQKGGNVIKGWSIYIRHFLLNELKRHHIRDAEFSVTAAMLLGVRNHLSPELRQSFSGAGAMHILCVSGLHVGIIFMLLNYFLSFFDHIKRGRLIRSIIILLSIWTYAMITGLSPSVIRAATMFSFISIGQNINRQVNTYNSLAASAFVLLVFNPYLILDVGFQLSYAAVIAIIALQPPLQNLWTPRWNILFKVWQLSTVSIAAQIGTAPLALYYFHSFPNYFLLTNLIVIPAAFAVFISGIVVLVFSWAGPLADYFAWILSKMVIALNTFITTIEQLPFAVSKNIYISAPELIILTLLSILMAIMLIHKKTKLLFVNLILIVLFLGANIYQKNLPNQFIVYQSGKYDYISFIHDNLETALTDADVIEYPELLDYQTLEHRIRFHIKTRQLLDLNKPGASFAVNFFHQKQFIGFHDLKIALINTDYSMIDVESPIELDYLIISGNPEIDIPKILKTYSCKKIIVSSSTAPWSIKKWKKEISKSEIPVHYVKEEGAFVLNLE